MEPTTIVTKPDPKNIYNIDIIKSYCISSSVWVLQRPYQDILDGIQEGDMKIKRIILPDGTSKFLLDRENLEKEKLELKQLKELRHKNQHEYLKRILPLFPKESESILKKFYAKVDIREETECWNWLGSQFNSGYGRIEINGKTIRAHRLAYTIHYGEIPDGMQINHVCHNKLCVNYRHLYAGTPKQNSEDMVRAGRWLGHTEFKEYANEIREIYNTGKYSYDNIVDIYKVVGINISKGAVANIIRGEIWKDDAYERLYDRKVEQKTKYTCCYTKEQEDEIREKYSKGGISQEQLSIEYGLSKGTIYNIVHNKTWRFLKHI